MDSDDLSGVKQKRGKKKNLDEYIGLRVKLFFVNQLWLLSITRLMLVKQICNQNFFNLIHPVSRSLMDLLLI